MLKYLVMVTQPSGQTGALDGVECSFVTNYIDCRELWVDEDFEMTAIGVKGRDPTFTWEIVGIYRATNDNIQIMERLAA